MSTARSKQQNGGGHSNKGLASKQMIDRIKEATGQSEEDITTMLMECNYDVNETIVALIESTREQREVQMPRSIGFQPRQPLVHSLTDPFCQVTGKKDKLRKKVRDRLHGQPTKPKHEHATDVVCLFQEEDRKKDAFKVVEVRRQGTGGRQRPQERAGTRVWEGGSQIT